MLRLDAVTAGYTDENIIHDISLHIDEGEIVTIIGPNGSGKSTLMKTIFGLTRQREAKFILGVRISRERSLKSWSGWALPMCPRRGTSFPLSP